MAFQGDAIFWVEIEKIVPNPFQPRREFNDEKLQELSESIRMYGILQPLTVTRKEIERDDKTFYTQYELIAGERRLRASRLAGLEQVPVIIRSGEQSEQEKLELAIIENLQREDLNAVDRALAFRQLADVFGLPHSAVAKKVGRSREYVSNTIRLLGLPDYMLSSLRTNDISEGHARTLLMLNDKPEEQDVIFREILLKKLSVREVERIVRKIASDKVRKKSWMGTDAVLIEMEREFTDTLGTRVQISKTEFGGKLTIDYFSDEDLQKLLLIMKSQGKITDFHMAGTEDQEGESSVVVTQLEKLTGATALESVSEPIQTPIVPTVTASVQETAETVQDAVETVIETEQAVSDVIEDVVVEHAQYAAENEVSEPRQGLEFVVPSEVLPHMQVPASSYVAYESSHQEPTVDTFAYVPSPEVHAPASIETPLVHIETQPDMIVREPIVPEVAPAQAVVPVVPEEKKDDEANLYSMHNFSL